VKNPIINPLQRPLMQQMVILCLSVWKAVVLSTKNVIVSGKQNFETAIIAGVRSTVEIIICHFRIPSIIPEAEDSKKIKKNKN
jgi:hypothetical protein